MLLSLHFYAACVNTINSIPAKLNIKTNSMSNCLMNISNDVVNNLFTHITDFTLMRALIKNEFYGEYSLTFEEQLFSLFLHLSLSAHQI